MKRDLVLDVYIRAVLDLVYTYSAAYLFEFLAIITVNQTVLP